MQLTQIIPVFKALTIRIDLLLSFVQTEPDKPYITLLENSIASFSSLNEIILKTGPNISSVAILLLVLTPETTVGSIHNPLESESLKLIVFPPAIILHPSSDAILI